MANTHGVATALTVMSPVRPGWPAWLRAWLWAARHVPAITAKLRKLSFIHFARWAIIDHIPYNGPPQEEENLRYSYLYFESNFNGSWDQYIDAFSQIVSTQMTILWGTSYGFPGPVPVAPFKEYIRVNEYVANHYYSAYPDATTTMILSSLEVKREADQLIAASHSLSPHDFSDAYRAFLTRLQRHL